MFGQKRKRSRTLHNSVYVIGKHLLSSSSLSLAVSRSQNLDPPARGRGVEVLVDLRLHSLCQALEAATAAGQYHAVQHLRLLLPLTRQDRIYYCLLFFSGRSTGSRRKGGEVGGRL